MTLRPPSSSTTDTREDMFVNDLVIIRAEGSDTKVEAIADVANLDGRLPSATPRPSPPASTPTRRWLPWASIPVPRATTASTRRARRQGSPGRQGRHPLRLTSLQATAWRVLSTAPISSATTASRRPSCAPRTRTSPSCIPALSPIAPSMPRRGQGVHRLLPDQQESPEDLGQVRL